MLLKVERVKQASLKSVILYKVGLENRAFQEAKSYKIVWLSVFRLHWRPLEASTSELSKRSGSNHLLWSIEIRPKYSAALSDFYIFFSQLNVKLVKSNVNVLHPYVKVLYSSSNVKP